jgi:hypothetical protein
LLEMRRGRWKERTAVHAQGRRQAANSSWALLVLAWGALGFSGCAGWWDELTSRDHKWGSAFNMKKEDPILVLKESTDGDKRAKAYRALKEPKQYGGNDQDQDVVLKILTQGATVERQPLCRLGSISALRTFRDPRAVEILKEAYYKSGDAPFSPDTTIVIKVQVLSALGETANPAAVELLVRVLREPPVVGTDEERQHKMDERIAAARALGRFRDPQAANALVEVLGKEKDVALRHRANDALQAATGQDLPPDAQKWQDYLQKNPLHGTEVVRDPGPVQKLISPIVPTGFRQ